MVPVCQSTRCHDDIIILMSSLSLSPYRLCIRHPQNGGTFLSPVALKLWKFTTPTNTTTRARVCLRFWGAKRVHPKHTYTHTHIQQQLSGSWRPVMTDTHARTHLPRVSRNSWGSSRSLSGHGRSVASSSGTTRAPSGSFRRDRKNAPRRRPSVSLDASTASRAGRVCHTFSLRLLNTGKRKPRRREKERASSEGLLGNAWI